MELEEYRKFVLETAKASASEEGIGTLDAFATYCLNELEDISTIPEAYTCFATGKYGRKSYMINAYAYDEGLDQEVCLFIVDYSNKEQMTTITKTEAQAYFDKLEAGLNAILHYQFEEEYDFSTVEYDLNETVIRMLKDNNVRKFKFFIISDRVKSTKIEEWEAGKINEIPLEYHIWDIQRFYRVLEMGRGHEPITITIDEWTKNGLPYLLASDASTDDVKSYLCVMPATLLADLYDRYSSELLEGNVRSFLTNRVKVNKSIRKTIKDEKEKARFFAYNNGISATASNVETKDGKITSIKNLQIVNGGQTTASLSNTRYKDKVSLDGIYVQMKLTEIHDTQLAAELVPNISRYSNSQTKVSDADFFSNHEFNVVMEKYSRRTYAPAVGGQQYETIWFFERSRGQYEQAQLRMTKGEKDRFKKINPKNQKITKTEFAKYRSDWSMEPYYACKGAQKNFAIVSEKIVEQWAKNSEYFNEAYFKDTVALAIMYKRIDKMVYHQPWYEQGYKINIVNYTISYFRYLIQQQYPNYEFDLMKIWNIQDIPDKLMEEFAGIAKMVKEHITDPNRPMDNVTEWTKKEDCWKKLKKKEYQLDPSIKDYLVDSNQSTNNLKKTRSAEMAVQKEVMKKSSDYWLAAIKWGMKYMNISEKDIDTLTKAKQAKSKKLSETQCQSILNVEAKLIEAGFDGVDTK